MKPFPPNPPAFVWASLAVMAVIIIMHLALLPQGQWYDEYFTFAFLRDLGWHGFLFRLTHWSPRPLSELLAFAYATAVRLSGRPLIAPVLACAWAILLAAPLLALRPWGARARSARWALALALPGLFLLAGPVGEMYYWPLGALAYLPALAATALATLLLAGPGLRPGKAAPLLAASLTVGALSAEIGAFFTLILCPLLMAEAAVRRGRNGIAPCAILLLPFGAAMAVMIALAQGRGADTTIPVHAVTYHHAWSSLVAAWVPLVRAAAGLDGSAVETIRRMAWLALLFAGSAAALRQAWPESVPRWPLVAVLAALFGTALLSIAGAFYTMGAVCCERHDSYRQGILVLMVVAGAALLPRRTRTLWATNPAIGPGLLAAAILVAAPARIAAIQTEYRLAGRREAAKAITFTSGQNSQTDTLDMPLPEAGPLLTPYHIASGQYSMHPLPAWYVQGPMLFFGKPKMSVRTERSAAPPQ